MMKQEPHRVVASAADSLAGSAKGLVSSVARGIKGAGESICSALDIPWKETLKVEGPHRVVGDVLDAPVDGLENAVNQGIIGSLQIMGNRLTRAVDRPLRVLRGLELPRLPR